MYLISETARQSGKGTDRWKRVVNLTSNEQQHLVKGGEVYFKSQYLSGGTHGTQWRRVDFRSVGGHNYYNPRKIDRHGIIEELNLMEGLSHGV